MTAGRVDFLVDMPPLSVYQIEYLSRMLQRARLAAHDHRDLVDMKTIDMLHNYFRRALDAHRSS